jgi:hypothetical protein
MNKGGGKFSMTAKGDFSMTLDTIGFMSLKSDQHGT